jgi:hypothetical protein
MLMEQKVTSMEVGSGTLLSAALCLVMAAQCLAAASRPKTVEIEWPSTCTADRGPASLTMTVSARGSVRYDGGLWRGKRWTRTQRIVPHVAQQFIATAASTEAPEAATDGHCLVVRLPGDHDGSVRKLPLQSAQAQQLQKQLLAATEIDPQKCASHETAPRQCGGVVLTFFHTENRACNRAHVINVYANGLVHYYVDKVAGSDRHARISPATIATLQEHPAEAALQQIAGVENYRMYSGSDALLLRERYESLIGIQWIRLDQSVRCADPTEYGPTSTIATIS